MAKPVRIKMPETRALRAWLAAFMAVFLVICGAVHAVAHASQPISSSILVMSAPSDDASADDRLNVEASHCQFCGATSVPAVAATPATDAPAARQFGRRSYDFVRDWKNSDPPPPKS